MAKTTYATLLLIALIGCAAATYQAGPKALQPQGGDGTKDCRWKFPFGIKGQEMVAEFVVPADSNNVVWGDEGCATTGFAQGYLTLAPAREPKEGGKPVTIDIAGEFSPKGLVAGATIGDVIAQDGTVFVESFTTDGDVDFEGFLGDLKQRIEEGVDRRIAELKAQYPPVQPEERPEFQPEGFLSEEIPEATF